MRHSLRCLCAHLPAATVAPVPAVVGALPNEITQLYEKCLDPHSPPSDVVRFASDLLPFIVDGKVELRRQLQLLNVLAARSVRNENVIQRCLWDTFKAPLPVNADAAMASDGLSLPELSAHTSRAFRLMAEQQFLNDPQMTAIALGRCVELAAHLTLGGVCDAYKGLRAINHMFFSTAEAAHHESELTANMTTKEFYETGDTPDAETLRNQPNLIDILCSELEVQLQRCALLLLNDGEGTKQLVPLEGTARLSSSTRNSAEEAQCFLEVVDSLAVVGVQHATTLDCLTSLIHRYRSSTSSGFFIHALDHATQIAERVVDPLMYEESASVADARRCLTLRLSEEIHRMPGAAGYLRHHPSELLLLRRLFEREASNTPALSPALWDTVRCIRVAHRHTVAASPRSPRPAGKLFDKKYAVKVKPISVDNSETERFVPPEFKSWRTPAATQRGGHPKNGRAPRRMAFGTRRIVKNYIQNKRKKYCPAVF